MEMRDATLLRADIYRPDDAEKHAAILLRTPYNKRLAPNYDRLLFDATQAGYAVVFQDVRGRFASDGEWRRQDMFTVEGPDGYDSIEWIASQPWCDGNVGMAGGSYLAGLQWLAAMEKPPHLQAIAPWMGGMRALNIGMAPQRSGGCISLATALEAIPMTALDVVNRLERQGRDVAAMRHTVERARSNPEEFYNFLPLKDLPLAQFEPIREMWNARLHPMPDEELQKYRRYEDVSVPCFHECGWYDILEYGEFESFRKMRERGGSPRARNGQHILAGPWTHGPPVTFLGDINFGPSAGGAAARVTEQQVAFYDRYLRGKDIQIPAVRYFVMGRNQWQTAEDWPLPQTQWQRFFLHSRGRANTAAGDGVLTRDAPTSEQPDHFIYDPHSPVPSVGGRVLGVGVVPGPVEQSRVEKRNDVLCYTTSELKEDIEVTGPVELHLFAATSARDTDFTAKLVDVYPDGSAYNFVEGIKRARGRNSESRPELVTPGEVNEYIITLGNTSQLFRKGHRICIDISSSNFPMFDRNMNTGNPIGEDAHGIPAMQTVYHQLEFPSHIDLPVIL